MGARNMMHLKLFTFFDYREVISKSDSLKVDDFVFITSEAYTIDLWLNLKRHQRWKISLAFQLFFEFVLAVLIFEIIEVFCKHLQYPQNAVFHFYFLSQF